MDSLWSFEVRVIANGGAKDGKAEAPGSIEAGRTSGPGDAMMTRGACMGPESFGQSALQDDAISVDRSGQCEVGVVLLGLVGGSR